MEKHGMERSVRHSAAWQGKAWHMSASTLYVLRTRRALVRTTSPQCRAAGTAAVGTVCAGELPSRREELHARAAADADPVRRRRAVSLPQTW